MNSKKKSGRISKKGKPPGTLLYIGEDRNHSPLINIYTYNNEKYLRRSFTNDIAFEQNIHNEVWYTWLDINAIYQVDLVSKVCSHFNIHVLSIEDILNTFQRSKVEEFANYTFVSCKMILTEKLKKENCIEFEQISFLLLEGTLITFQELPGDNFDTIRNRFEIKESRLRQKAPDYLLYLLLDTIVDEYIDALEMVTKKVESIEEKINLLHSNVDLTEIKENKNTLLSFRKVVYPVQEVVQKLNNSENLFIKPDTIKYLNDLMDHIKQVIEQIDFLLDMNKSLHDLHFSTLSLRMNKIMETLTVITAIFIPLTFIVGVYGMNFTVMPELEWRYGYFLVWLLMVAIALIMIAWFKRRKWL